MLKPPVQRIYLNSLVKQNLITLKKIFKIEHWNILCRWAFAVSLMDVSPPAPNILRDHDLLLAGKLAGEKGVEMTWQVFAGTQADSLLLGFRQRCQNDGLPLDDDKLMADAFMSHLIRGIASLRASHTGDGRRATILDLFLLTQERATTTSLIDDRVDLQGILSGYYIT